MPNVVLATDGSISIAQLFNNNIVKIHIGIMIHTLFCFINSIT